MIKEINLENINEYKSIFINECELISNPFGKYLVYIENNIVMGCLYYSYIYDRYEINQLDVDEKYRGRSIATELLTLFTDSVDKIITLEVSVENTIAIRLYKKLGFKEVAIRKSYYNGTDAILMQKNK